MAKLMPIDQQELDNIFPTIVRYTGLIVVIAIMTKALFFGGIDPNVASLIVPATGMFFYKDVVKSNGTKRKGDVEEEERWSHLP